MFKVRGGAFVSCNYLVMKMEKKVSCVKDFFVMSDLYVRWFAIF